MDNMITIFGQEIEVDYDKILEIKKSLLQEDEGDLAKEFANIITRLEANGKGDIEDLLGYTIGTIGKCYDDEEETSAIIEDTEKRIKGEAKYMQE